MIHCVIELWKEFRRACNFLAEHAFCLLAALVMVAPLRAGELRGAAGVVDITPPLGIQLGGYEELRPDRTQLVPLSLLVLGDPRARATVAENVAVTIDGCKLACSTKMVKESGGTVSKDVAVLDVFRRHRDLKPLGIAVLNPEGLKLARVIAEEMARHVDDLAARFPGSSTPRKEESEHA